MWSSEYATGDRLARYRCRFACALYESALTVLCSRLHGVLKRWLFFFAIGLIDRFCRTEHGADISSD